MKIQIPRLVQQKLEKQNAENEIIKNAITVSGNHFSFENTIMVYKDDAGEFILSRSMPISCGIHQYISPFPNPVHIFLQSAINHLQTADTLREKLFPLCSKQSKNHNFKMLRYDEHGTSDLYNSYLENRIITVTMVVSSLEAFVNQMIPNDFIYKTIRENKDMEFKKKDIEGSQLAFNEKIEKVLPSAHSTFTWQGNEDILKGLKQLNGIRNKFIHLKTRSKSQYNLYERPILDLMNMNLPISINNAIWFMNQISKDFVVMEVN